MDDSPAAYIVAALSSSQSAVMSVFVLAEYRCFINASVSSLKVVFSVIRFARCVMGTELWSMSLTGRVSWIISHTTDAVPRGNCAPGVFEYNCVVRNSCNVSLMGNPGGMLNQLQKVVESNV